MMKLNLHHVGVLVKDIPAATRYYVECLGYERRSEIVHDPTQSAYVQFFRLPDDRVYLELVSPDRPDSKLTNALEKGGGLNHVCYSTDDIEAACNGLRTAGLFLVSRPVSAVAFNGRRIAWLMGADRIPLELVEKGPEGEL
jgi:methylmalonyl-CoA/ethylmalonyl-CoA epimerase